MKNKLYMFLVLGTVILAVTVVSFGNISLSESKSVVKNAYLEKTSIKKKVTFKKAGEMVASWYGPKFHGKLTANGEIYDQMAFTAAHKTLPFGTILKVTNPKNGKSVIVRINDRGPYIEGRNIDLSKGTAIALGMVEKGVIKVEVEKLVEEQNTPIQLALK